ncbi:glycoside hydrolase family 3 protein [Microlunatus elymi]|uniref:beta-glucosidase n=1 Tax=Microlunatus elymi TaxID=2596828 RepID=A0A516Q070_9ACTN|nr:glycoside hydrolase family 3 N-terminal domain-containing protein [Microlunatus elymi]QDP96782.1 glycoside hydrolase family 3 protein [Microlunatus elymi]
MDNDVQFPYQDPALPVRQRIGDLLERMTLEDKAGLLFHTMVRPGSPDSLAADDDFGLPSPATLLRERRMNHFNLLGAAGSARELAQWHNAAQRLAAEVGLGIPITFSTDPRHAFTDNPGAAMMSGPFSQWPEPIGLAAIGDPELVRRFADIARQEYLAVGLRVALHPQIDLATEPRWARISGTFGEDAALTGELGAAYVRGFQGERLGPDSVSTMIKHFPGGGPQLDGEDPHFSYGREQVYPSGNFDYHLRPFREVLAAGASQVMPYYAMPVGTDHPEVGFSFNKSVVTGILRTELGFDGIVCTDWGLLTDDEIMGQPMPARAWGVEHLSCEDRALMIMNAGVDQFGGEACPELIINLVRSGRLGEDRLDISVRRLLLEKFRLGLFDDRRFVDAEAAASVVGRDDFRTAGDGAQRRSLTLLTNHDLDSAPILPLKPGHNLYLEGVDPELASGYGTPVDAPQDADVALIRLSAPYEPRTGGFESFFHAGSLAFDDHERDRITDLCRTVPTIVIIHLDRPAVMGEIIDAAAAVVADYGASDAAVLDVITGAAQPQGRLPFDLPRSMAAVENSDPDAPFATEDPIFRFGHGLRYD